MREPLAISVAIDLLNKPSRVWDIRSAPLPSGVGVLLQIAAGDAQAESEAAAITGRSKEFIRGAAAFFIEQILFYSEADSYRVLGVNPQATSSELRHNMALLLSWLHPDIERGGTRSLFATNVTNAWNDLKTDDRRALYDSSRPLINGPSPNKKLRGHRLSRADTFRGRSGFAALIQNRPGRPSVFVTRAKKGLLSCLWLFVLGRLGR